MTKQRARGGGMRINEVGPLLRQRHGRPVRKLCLRLGADCPNRDGTLGHGGCLFCAEGPARPAPPLEQQLEQGLRRTRRGEPALIAYLQDHSATHLTLARLERFLRLVRTEPRVVAVHIGTRPDCLPDEVLELLAGFQGAGGGPELLLELGLQSASDETLALINRQHTVACFSQAVRRLHRAGLPVCAHVVLGLPRPLPGGELGREGPAEAAATAGLLATLGVEAVKVHNCHVLRGTPLARLYRQGRYEPPGLEAYVEALAALLSRLPASVEIHRLMGEARPPLLLAPDFTGDKARSLERIRRELRHRGVVQGSGAAGQR